MKSKFLSNTMYLVFLVLVVGGILRSVYLHRNDEVITKYRPNEIEEILKSVKLPKQATFIKNDGGYNKGGLVSITYDYYTDGEKSDLIKYFNESMVAGGWSIKHGWSKERFYIVSVFCKSELDLSVYLLVNEHEVMQYKNNNLKISATWRGDALNKSGCGTSEVGS